ncbi:tenascin isoform X1 [Alosa alosa]|uniref:tenascin isoform X1 n=1 Tax=Alosa alosa TaxID=278164 RepID=UPI0020154328|nr:tenascin isoform X1 [Alosa alosa]XP_048085158.1 tenascin isoform X1 [Alosa alosa]
MLVLFLTLLILTLPGPAHLSTDSAESPQATNGRVSRDTKPKGQPIKVIISNSCAQGDSTGGDKELELDPDSPLVLTHRIRLVPTAGGGGAAGTCGGCEAEFAALRERLERLEREVSALREKCGGPEGGCCASEQSKGPGCTVPRPLTCPDDCNDQGRCVDGKCVCFPGYSGDDCSDSTCPDNCSDNGKCVNGQCVCNPGFTGPDCSTRTCPDNCNNQGRCVNGRCVCNPGFAAPDCATRSCPDNCKNRGKCVNGQCVCDPGFTGPDCSTRACPDNCNDRGQCVNGKCVCDSGFTGPDCSEATCPDNCNNRGQCVNGKCVCESGFTGPDCSGKDCPNNCRNRGKCVNGQCVCDPGFTGPDCSTKTCPDNCNNRGRCVNGKCVCEAGFTGPDCGTKSCPNNCTNKGRCVRGKCVCRRGFTGPDCSECEPGLSGPDCSTALTGVTRLTTKDITESSVTLTWTPPPVQYDSYQITITSQKEGDQKITSSVGGRLTSYTQTGLAPGQEYHVSITGEKDGQPGTESTTEFTTKISAPTKLEVVKTSTTFAIIQWEPPQMEIDRYHLSVVPSDGGDQGRQKKALPPSVSAQIDDLVAGTPYDVTLVAEKDGKQSPPVTIQVVPAEPGETLSMVTTETKPRPVSTDTDKQKLPPKPVRNGTFRRPGMPRPPHFNATRPGTGPKRVPPGGLPKQPGAHPGKPRWTSFQPDLPTSDREPLSATVTDGTRDEGSQGEPGRGTSATDKTRDPAAPAPQATEVSGNTTGHPNGKKCHSKLIVGHRHLNGTIKTKVPVIKNMTHATDEEKIDALVKELQRHNRGHKNPSSEEQGIDLHISVFEVSPGLLPNADFIKTPLASKTSAENDNDHISITKLLGLPLTLSTPSTPSQPSDRGSDAAVKRLPDSSESGGSGKSPSSEYSDSVESSEYDSPSSSASEESSRTEIVVTSSESEPGRSEESDTGGSKPLKPSGFPKGKFTRRPGIGPFQNRTRPHFGPPLTPSRGPIRRPFPHRVPNGGLPNGGLPNGGLPNGGVPNGGPSVQPGSGETTETRAHLKQRPGVIFRKRNDTRPGKPQLVRPALPHSAISTAPPQLGHPMTSHPDDGENGHDKEVNGHDKEETSTGSPFSSEEVPASSTEKPKADRMRYPPGKTPPKRPGFNGGNGGVKTKLKPGVTWRRRNGTAFRPPTVYLASTKTTPPPTSHRVAVPHAENTALPDSVKPTEETLTDTEDVNVINGHTQPDDFKMTSTKPKPGVTNKRKDNTVVQLPPGHKPMKHPLGKTDSAETTDTTVPAQPIPKSPDTTQGSTTDGQEGEQLSHVGVQKESTHSVTLRWGAPDGMFKNFVVTQKRPTKGEDPDNRMAEGVRERQEEGEEGDSEGPATSTDITGPSPKASPNDTFTKVLPGSARSFLFKGLQPQTQYVLSVFGTGPGVRSKTHSVTINTGPEPPSNLLFTDITDTTVSVSWTKPRSPVTGFKVTYTHTLEGEPVSVSVGAADTTVDLSQLTPGSSYEVSIISLQNLDESDPLKDTVHTLPDPPTDLHAINITDSRALLLWRPALAAVDNYVIVYGSEKGPDVTISVSGNAAAQQLTGLDTSTDYSVTITSHLGNRKSDGATTVFTTTGGSGRVGDGPKDLTASQVTPRSAVLKWKPPSSKASGYKLQYAIEGQAFQDAFVGPDLNDHRLVRLRPGAKYIVRLQAEIGGVYTEAITTEFTTGSLRFPYPTDCSQELLNGAHESGLVEIFPNGPDSEPVSAYCDMETDGGGWTLFQRRVNGKVNFYRGWKDYRSGFGDPSEEFWMGNDLLHNMTKMKPMSLRVDMRAEGESVFAKYSSFSIGQGKTYTLRVSGYTGNAGDSMTYHNGRVFSTRDRDLSDIRVCAISYRGGWWYRNCHEANLNGLYGTIKNHQGVIWTTWKGKEYSIPFVEMKMRPTSFRPPSQG